MHLDFVKLSPTQNMTILVTSPVDQENHKIIASKLMRYDNVFAEQVGFVEAPKNNLASARLQMMGGEFCGNATMALASYITWTKGLPSGTTNKVLLEVSGSSGLLECTVDVFADCLKGKVKMPSAKNIEEIEIDFEEHKLPAHKVTFDGIVHYIIDENLVSFFDCSQKEDLVKLLSNKENLDAIGIMFWNKQNNRIAPLVYLPNNQSIIWERGCGSGSAALGYVLSYLTKDDIEVDISQPGGIIRVFANKSNEAWIEGTVKIVATGTAYI